ncbi:MAG: peptide chain release factor N(5)-glutamine methyltransferase [Candidatus Pacebacteria bacterium]|nr:peptide chain release factor N(5)-glutamine methyltransferase [Candidatus Paceibacterota bacterium]
MNIQQALKKAATELNLFNIPSASLDAEVLLLEALNRNVVRNDNEKLDKNWLYAHNNHKLTEKEEELFNNFIDQRKKHKPVAYIINRKEFFGYEFYVNENVLIPRPETELIVEEVLKIITGVNSLEHKNYSLIDIGTGSGCILISILNELRKNKKNDLIKQSIAIDISKKAIEIATINAKRYSLENNIKFINKDFKKELDQKLFSSSNHFVITANLPYITDNNYEKLDKNVKDYEPKIALTSGTQGLDDIKNMLYLISKISIKINQKIYLLIEADPDQINVIKEYLKKHFKDTKIAIINDLSGKKRLVIVSLFT